MMDTLDKITDKLHYEKIYFLCLKKKQVSIPRKHKELLKLNLKKVETPT